MKTCSNKTCSSPLPQSVENFWRDPRNKDGLQSQCKTCKNASNKRWYDSNPDKVKAYESNPDRIARHKEKTYAWREANKDKYNEYMRQKNKERYPNARLERYGKDNAWFEQTLSAQGGVCAICKKPNPSKKRALAVDHCHETGKTRGILCYGCNRLMVLLDNEELLQNAIEYKKRVA